jgi:hypothetical protein
MGVMERIDRVLRRAESYGLESGLLLLNKKVYDKLKLECIAFFSLQYGDKIDMEVSVWRIVKYKGVEIAVSEQVSDILIATKEDLEFLKKAQEWRSLEALQKRMEKAKANEVK